jgi:hypothetical protein
VPAESLALQAGFADAADRASYAELLAQTAPAAADSLRMAWADSMPTPWSVVGEELGRLYEQLLPSDVPRAAALSWHATWLERVVGDPLQTCEPPAPLTRLTALIIRAAHVQIVRLRGGGNADDLQREIQLVRELASRAGPVTTADPERCGGVGRQAIPLSRSEASARDTVRIRALAARALATHNRRRSAIAPVDVDLDAYYNDACLRTMSMNLPPAEVSCLLASSRSRSEGLRLCRSGYNDDARAMLATARATLATARLTEEAKIVAESFQQPAEAYLHYRLGDAAAARQALLVSLECCAVMGAKYGYEVEARRVHLARNVVRVDRVSGDQSGALHLALRLVRYIDGSPAAWPFPPVALTDPASLSVDERRVLMEQVWDEISQALLEPAPGTADLWSDPELAAFALPDSSMFWQLRAWLDAMHAFCCRDAATFLERACTFFAAGPVVPKAWHALTDALLRMSTDI